MQNTGVVANRSRRARLGDFAPFSLTPPGHSHPLGSYQGETNRHAALPLSVTETFVVVTDDATLARLDRPRARLRCLSCREIHLLTQARQTDSIVTA